MTEVEGRVVWVLISSKSNHKDFNMVMVQELVELILGLTLLSLHQQDMTL